MSVLLYYAHPGDKYSHTNTKMWEAAKAIDGLTRVDLYYDYPRFDIDVDVEQQRLLDHDIIIFQFPLFWYSVPSLLKEWIDLTLEYGFAYGHDGDKLAGKTLQLALTAAGTEEAYSDKGYQHFPLRTFLTPLEQTARLCDMKFATPYVLHGSLRAIEDGRIPPHIEGYRKLLIALRDRAYNFEAAGKMPIVQAADIDKLVGK